jgi:antitoxin component of MazEF toxin-antitoxin module
MKGTVRKWGNSAAVRIPAAVLEAAHVDLDQDVDVREEAGRIIIEPVRTQRRYTLEELVAQCDPKKRLSREERAWLDAPPVGREAL